MSTNANQMEYIWERIPKLKDGKTIRYLKSDIDYLYYHGFVDTTKYTIEQWKAAFTPFKTKEGNFELNKAQFLSLRAFRYTGPAHEVFDPMRITEGPWSDDDLNLLYKRSVAKASALTSKTFWAYIDALKKIPTRVNEDGHFIIDKAVKIGLYQLIEKYPSPRRRLEKEVRRIRKERDERVEGLKKNRDASGFTVGQTAKEATLEQYQNFVTSSVADQKTEAPIETEEEAIDLKKLRKPGKKFFG